MVEIPDDVAKNWARHLRRNAVEPEDWYHIIADLLDPDPPPPPTLRDLVVRQFREFDIHWDDDAANVVADAVLAVVADRIKAEGEKPPRSWGMEVTPDFYAGLALAESLVRGETGG